MALGATRRNVLQLVLGSAIALIATGVALGVGASLALSSILRTLLFQVSERDPATFIAIAVTLATIGFVASALPARRATRVDPVEALQTDGVGFWVLRSGFWVLGSRSRFSFKGSTVRFEVLGSEFGFSVRRTRTQNKNEERNPEREPGTRT